MNDLEFWVVVAVSTLLLIWLIQEVLFRREQKRIRNERDRWR